MAPKRTDFSRPNKISKTAQYARQCRIVAAGLDAGETIEAIAEQLGRSGRQVYRIKLNFEDLGYPATKATDLLVQQLGDDSDHSTAPSNSSMAARSTGDMAIS